MVLKASPRPKRECPRLVYRDLRQSGFWKFAKVVCYVYSSHTSGKRDAPVTSLLISDDILWEYKYICNNHWIASSRFIFCDSCRGRSLNQLSLMEVASELSTC